MIFTARRVQYRMLFCPRAHRGYRILDVFTFRQSLRTYALTSKVIPFADHLVSLDR